MRHLVTLGLVLASATAFAHPSGHDTPVVHDHRSSSSEEHAAPVFHDHRSSSEPVTVRDHRGGGGGDGAVYVAPTDEVIVDDGLAPAAAAPTVHPNFILELGGIARRFTGPSLSRIGTVETTSGDTVGYDLASGTPTQGDTAGGAFDMRLLAPLGDHLYAGADLELGGLTRSPIQLMSDSSDIHIASRSMIGSAAVIGARARHGIAELDGELAGGVRVLSTTVQSMDAGDEDPSETENAVSGVVEARVRGAVWVSPHVYLGATAGISMLDSSDRSFGLAIGLASFAFGSAP
jgi:hypothetical protein